jgi:hypothetical protein
MINILINNKLSASFDQQGLKCICLPSSPCAKVCNSGAPPTKIQSDLFTMERHNSILTRDASIENLEQTASRWILLSISKVLYIFIAIHVTYFRT